MDLLHVRVKVQFRVKAVRKPLRQIKDMRPRAAEHQLIIDSVCTTPVFAGTLLKDWEETSPIDLLLSQHKINILINSYDHYVYAQRLNQVCLLVFGITSPASPLLAADVELICDIGQRSLRPCPSGDTVVFVLLNVQVSYRLGPVCSPGLKCPPEQGACGSLFSLFQGLS